MLLWNESYSDNTFIDWNEWTWGQIPVPNQRIRAMPRVLMELLNIILPMIRSISKIAISKQAVDWTT